MWGTSWRGVSLEPVSSWLLHGSLTCKFVPGLARRDEGRNALAAASATLRVLEYRLKGFLNTAASSRLSLQAKLVLPSLDPKGTRLESTAKTTRQII